jgi:hypothetical protein
MSTEIVNLEYAICKKAYVWLVVNRLTSDPAERSI